METELREAHKWQNETVELALAKAEGKAGNPGFVWLGGFKSDMAGTKAEAMVQQAASLNCGSLRFDYSGHGQSGGKFIDGTISRWVDETVSVFLNHTSGPQIVLGSSMGGWIALRLAQELTKREEENHLAGMILIAPAPDFTKELMEPEFSDEQRKEIKERGFIEEPSEYSDEPNIITNALIEDGRCNLVLAGDLTLSCPVHILQGMQDPDVPYQHAMKLVSALTHDDVTISMIKYGDHRLSRESDIELLKRTMSAMVGKAV